MNLPEHWQRVYREREPTQVSWYQRHPTLQLDAIARVADPSQPLVDVGAGASTLADHLLLAGHTDVTVLDLSADALAHTARRLHQPAALHLEVADVRTWRPERTFATWHDRAVFHFFTEPADQQAYRATLAHSLRPGGHAIVWTFHTHGPGRCSDLPTARYDAATLHQALGGPDAFDLIDAPREDHVRPDGRTQAFQGVVLRRR